MIAPCALSARASATVPARTQAVVSRPAGSIATVAPALSPAVARSWAATKVAAPAGRTRAWMTSSPPAIRRQDDADRARGVHRDGRARGVQQRVGEVDPGRQPAARGPGRGLDDVLARPRHHGPPRLVHGQLRRADAERGRGEVGRRAEARRRRGGGRRGRPSTCRRRARRRRRRRCRRRRCPLRASGRRRRTCSRRASRRGWPEGRTRRPRGGPPPARPAGRRRRCGSTSRPRRPRRWSRRRRRRHPAGCRSPRRRRRGRRGRTGRWAGAGRRPRRGRRGAA